MVSPTSSADVVVIGDGLIGLSTALELGRHAKVCVIGTPSDWIASTAAAGLLIPAIERLPEAARPFYADSLARFPALIDVLREFDPKLVLIQGVVERHDGRDVLHESDAAVDNVRLWNALRAAVAAAPTVTRIEDFVAGIDADGVETRSGRRIAASRIVLAAGAASPSIAGLPRALPVRPLKGQMIALGANVLARAMMGDDIYLVPRGDETIVGATVEDAGFDVTNTPAGTESLRTSALSLCPELGDARITRAWAGVRPATPDLLPILGGDPTMPGLIYACGHSKNGVLLTPATAVAIAAVCRGATPPIDITPFSISRFF